MSSLTDDEVRMELKEQQDTSQKWLDAPMPRQPTGKPGQNPFHYINRLMEDQTRYKMKGTGNKGNLNYVDQNDILFQQKVSSSEASPAYPDQETWQHITLAPGVELHLRHPLDRDIQSRVLQMINYAKRMFSIKSYRGNK